MKRIYLAMLLVLFCSSVALAQSRHYWPGVRPGTRYPVRPAIRTGYAHSGTYGPSTSFRSGTTTFTFHTVYWPPYLRNTSAYRRHMGYER